MTRRDRPLHMGHRLRTPRPHIVDHQGPAPVQALQHYLALYGYAALLPLAVIEGPAVTVLAGVLAANGVLDLTIIYPVVVVGDLVGDLLHYAVGRWLSLFVSFRDWRWTVRLRARAIAVAPLVRWNAAKMLLIGKLTHSAGFAVLLAAGAVRVPLTRFLAWNFIGTVPKSIVLLLAGYCFGRLFLSVRDEAGIAGAAGFVLALIGFGLMARRFFAARDSGGA
jgi:membrane protein DedA with SNARE-associated domain